MARKKLPQEYRHPIDLEEIADRAIAGEMPIANALAMLHRSSVLSQDFIDAVAKDARRGYKFEAIAARVGVAPRTLASWLHRGKEKREAIDEWHDKRRTLPADCDAHTVLAEIGEEPHEDDLSLLYDTCARSYANAECELFDVIHTAAVISGDVRAAQWLLVNRFENWKGGQVSGRGDRPGDSDSNCAGAVDQLAAKIAAFDASRRSVAAASSARR